MRLFLQLTDAAGLVHEIEMPAYCEGGHMTGIDELPGCSILRLSTAAGEARIQLPPDYSPDWQIAGWRRE